MLYLLASCVDDDSLLGIPKKIAEATGLTDASISRIIHAQHIDHVAYASAYLIAAWLGVHGEDLSELEDADK